MQLRVGTETKPSHPLTLVIIINQWCCELYCCNSTFVHYFADQGIKWHKYITLAFRRQVKCLVIYHPQTGYSLPSGKHVSILT